MEGKQRGRKRFVIAAVVLCAAAVCVAVGVGSMGRETPIIWEAVETVAQRKPPAYQFQVHAPVSSEMAEDGLPHDKLFITRERKSYQDGDMTLRIPKLEIIAPVWSGTDEERLKKGACLYEYAQLPGEGNRNVSIAAHRNGIKNGKPTDQALFYYVDTLKEGDYLYLQYNGSIYRYLYTSSFVVNEEDWGPIYSQGYSCLTLTTCTPVSIQFTEYRLVVQGKLDQVIPDSDSFVYETGAPS